jgi:hypothetical protein
MKATVEFHDVKVRACDLEKGDVVKNVNFGNQWNGTYYTNLRVSRVKVVEPRVRVFFDQMHKYGIFNQHETPVYRDWPVDKIVTVVVTERHEVTS